MISGVYLVAVAGALLLFLLYREWKRNNKARLYGRLTASVLLVASLLLMAYPHAGKDKPGSKRIIVLTEGYKEDSLAVMLQTAGDSASIYKTNADLRTNINRSIQLVTDWRLFAARHKKDTIHIIGTGVSEEALEALDPLPVVFHSNGIPPTITNVYWKQQLQPGEPLTVQGHYENNSSQKIKMALQVFGADMDTVLVDAFASSYFNLRTTPVHHGRAVYTLKVTAGTEVLQAAPVPVTVTASPPLQLLIISASPDFENTFLKDNLSAQGYAVSMITAISTGKTSKQFLNTSVQAGPLTLSYLNRFDVIIADETALLNMHAAELSAIRSAVSNNGTGLLIRLEAANNAAAFYSAYFPVKALPKNRQSFLLSGDGLADSAAGKIKITDPLTIVEVPGTQAILHDGPLAVFASGTVYGIGKIIGTTLQNTYSMALAGNKASYQQLWWLLLNKAARKKLTAEAWQVYPFIPLVDDPVQLQLTTNDSVPEKALLHQTSIYLAQNTALPFQWKGWCWPVAAGWQPLPRVHAETGSWYVYRRGDWMQLTDYTHTAATKRYAALHPVVLNTMAGKGQYPFNWRLLLLLVFLSCCTFLWVEQKRG